MSAAGATLALVADHLVGFTVNEALAKLLKARMDKARALLTEELKRGLHPDLSQDELAAALFKYLRAAQEGMSARNLRMLAQSLGTLASEQALIAETFRRDTESLASLSVEEIILLRAFLAALKAGLTEPNEIWNDAANSLKGTASFPDLEALVVVASALTRTGFVVPWPTLSGMIFIPTTTLQRVARRVDFTKDDD